MKSYIENIRKSLKKLGYAPTSDQIRHAINIVCPSGVNILESKSAIVDEVVKLLSAPTRYTESQIVAENSPLPTPQPAEEQETGIVVSSEDKQDLISSQASCLGIELSEVEVVDLATSIKDGFLDHECLIEEVVTAIVTYHDHRTDRLEQKIKDAREHIEYRRKQLNQTLVGEFGEMNNFFRQGAYKRKELSKVIAAAFKT